MEIHPILGFYERLTVVIKTYIRKVLFKRKMSEDQLTIVLANMESRVNNLTLTYTVDEVDHPAAWQKTRSDSH